MKIKNSALFLIALVLVVSIFVYYRYAQGVFQSMKPAAVTVPTVATSKEVSAEVTYSVSEEKSDTLRFVVTMNKEGIIESIQTLDAETGQIPEKKKAFNEEVNVLLKGKKLSDLGPIDKVAQSSLTTKAFNEVLPKLQAAAL